MNPELRPLVRQRFEGVPDDTFNQVSLDHWFEMLSFADQIAIVEEFSMQKEARGESVSREHMIHQQIPLDVWAVMLKDAKNSTLRALCRVDKFFYENCFAITKKIGVYRHGTEFGEALEYRGNSEERARNRKYPVEYLIAYEIIQVAQSTLKDPELTSRFYFENTKEALEMQLFFNQNQDSYATLYAMNDRTKEYLQKKIPLDDLGPPVAGGDVWFLLQVPTIGEFMNLLARDQFHLWKVEADEVFETQSQKGGKPYTYRGVRERKDVDRMTMCIVCNTQKATYLCGNMCNKSPLYCSKKCQTTDWPAHYKQCILLLF